MTCHKSVRQMLEDVSTWTHRRHPERDRPPRRSITWLRLLSDSAVWSRASPSTESHSRPLLHTCAQQHTHTDCVSIPWVYICNVRYRGDRNESNLYRDVCVGVSPVEDGSEVELWVSLCIEYPRPYGVILTVQYGVNIWSCGPHNTTRCSEETGCNLYSSARLKCILRYFQGDMYFFIQLHSSDGYIYISE